MDNSIFKKMRVKPESVVMVLNAPSDYPKCRELNWQNEGQAGYADFVHLFVDSQAQFVACFVRAIENLEDNGLLWVSYPKSKSKKVTYDINRDSLWGLLLTEGFHPVSQVSLGDDWSAVRVKKNQEGVVYERPSNVKGAKENKVLGE